MDVFESVTKRKLPGVGETRSPLDLGELTTVMAHVDEHGKLLYFILRAGVAHFWLLRAWDARVCSSRLRKRHLHPLGLKWLYRGTLNKSN